MIVQMDREARQLMEAAAPARSYDGLRERGWATLSERGLVWCMDCDRAVSPDRRRDRFGNAIGKNHFDRTGHHGERGSR